ncbi:MAG: twitching motility protein PilT [Candidatus Latescibacteria bacterium]|nr:twitching motility protein PilT [Candidatus Latescibacterota bacterium]
MDVKEILSKAAAQISQNLSGVERQQCVAQLVESLPREESDVLRSAINGLLAQMATKNASDIDLGGGGCGGRVWYRIYGEKKPDEASGPFTQDQTDLLFHSLLMERQREYLYLHRNLDFSYAIEWEGKPYRFRADLYFDLDHLALNMRYVANVIRPFKNIELHPNAVKAVILTYDKQGLTLVTGITGSGKSSTLDSIIDANNQLVDGHIVIIGSPIETIHQPQRSIVRHREVGRDVLSFKEGAVQALRQDPDIIVIGEMRDPETIITALEITDSGHKVFSTLHTASASDSVDRIVGECPPEEQNRVRERLGDVLKCIISQKLVPSLDGKRALVKEVLVVNSSVRSAIKNNNTSEIYQMMHEGNAQGMNTMEQDLKRLVDARKISDKEAINFANNKRRMEELL